MTQIGNYKIISVNEGFCRLDGGAMFGVVPKALWNRNTDSDEKNCIELAQNVLVLRSEVKTIIIDTGCGSKWNEKQKKIYQISLLENGLKGALLKNGIEAEDVTDVIYTHLHFDHAGGGTEFNSEGISVPTFPNATYHVQKKQWEWAHSPSEKDRASYLPENLSPLEKSGQLNIIDGPGTLYDGIELEITDSHTVGHQAVKISDGKNTIYHCGDVIPMAAHIPVPYVMAYDLMPLNTISAKKEILKNAADKGWKIFVSHDPAAPLQTIEKAERGFRGSPAPL